MRACLYFFVLYICCIVYSVLLSLINKIILTFFRVSWALAWLIICGAKGFMTYGVKSDDIFVSGVKANKLRITGTLFLLSLM